MPAAAPAPIVATTAPARSASAPGAGLASPATPLESSMKATNRRRAGFARIPAGPSADRCGRLRNRPPDRTGGPS
ncbi:hypothetical protein ACQP1O_09115 [Nocardia sp. CA-151230]|uniref:hypothetical protein n=1 Tax=Nocardia sp. CA-151230 TaxID=3239982 RepID=UPI003D8A9829